MLSSQPYHKERNIQQTNIDNIKFNGWSTKSLHVHVRVVGPEIVAPLIEFTTLNVCNHGSSNSSSHNKKGHNTDCTATKDEIIIATYVLTVPGKYKLEMRLMGFYPGTLFTWSSDELSWGFYKFHHVFLGGSESRCKPYTQCHLNNACCDCDSMSYVTGAPFKLHSVTNPSNKCNGLATAATAVLPYCTNGNHAGRWLQFPTELQEICKGGPWVAKYIDILKGPDARNWAKHHQIGIDYRTFVQDINASLFPSTLRRITNSENKEWSDTITRWVRGAGGEGEGVRMCM